MKRIFLHVGAGLFGFSVAAIIVLLVFSNADRDGSATSGTAQEGVSSSAATKTCKPGNAIAQPSAADRARLAKEHPFDIYDAQQRAVTLTDARQERWVEEIHAQVAGCIDEVTLSNLRTEFVLTIPDGQTPAQESQQRNTLVRAVVHGACRGILRRPTVKVQIGSTDSAGATMTVSCAVYGDFQRNRRALSLPDTIPGLISYARTIGYRVSEFQVTGFTA